MRTVCYLIGNTPEALQACHDVEMAIPCFTSRTYAPDRTSFEYEIQCREQDLPFVEHALAPHV